MVLPSLGTEFAKQRACILVNELCCKELGTFNNDLPNLSMAVERRVFTVSDGNGGYVECPKPVVGAFDRLNVVDIVLDKFDKRYASRMSYDEFLHQCPKHARKSYAKAIETNRIEGVQRHHSWIYPFVKNEKVDTSKACRLISPRHKRYNVELGRYTRAIEEEMYRAIGRAWNDVWGDENTIAKGMTVSQIGRAMRQKWDAFMDPVAVGLDASRFDQHVSRQALVYEHEFYRRLFSGDKFLIMLLKWQLRNRFVVKMDGMKYTFFVDGTRMSGDMNTALGNCIIMSTLLLEYCLIRGVNAKLINNGDDCVVFMERADLAKFSAGLAEWFLDKGFEMKIEPPCYVFEEIEFCQMHPVYSRGWIMVRNVAGALTKDCMSLGARTITDYKRWLHAVGQCGYSLYGDMPIFSSMYTSFMNIGIPSNIRYSNLLANSGFMRLGKYPRVRLEDRIGVSDQTRLSFQRAFGITVTEQLEVETLFNNFTLADKLSVGAKFCGLKHLARGIL